MLEAGQVTQEKIQDDLKFQAQLRVLFLNDIPHFELIGCVTDVRTNMPVKIKRMTLCMGVHPNYVGGGPHGEDNCSSMHIYTKCSAFSESVIGGDVFFDLANGGHAEIRHLRLAKPSPDFSTGTIPIVDIPFSDAGLIDEIGKSPASLLASSLSKVISGSNNAGGEEVSNMNVSTADRSPSSQGLNK